MYSLFRRALFHLPPETAHHLTLVGLNCLAKLPGASLFKQRIISNPQRLMGLDFPNTIGNAAGLDKNAEYIDALALLGFGFIEIGTLTLKPQGGNPKPRLFRLPKENALINRMGFNNLGIDNALKNIRKAKYKGILGINIGKNASTPLNDASAEYVECFKRVYQAASYITVNISSPNTKDLRDLQHGDYLEHLLTQLKEAQQELTQKTKKYVPMVVKIAPDLTDKEIEDIASLLIKLNVDGVIATNTTNSRIGVEGHPHGGEKGGLSGSPLTQLSTQVTQKLHQALSGNIPIIASGGIMSAKDAEDKIKAGAQLIQLFSGLIYHGPGLVSEVARAF